MVHVEFIIANLKVKHAHAIEYTAQTAGLQVDPHGWDRIVVSGEAEDILAWVANDLEDVCDEIGVDIWDLVA